jgi:hypothetical protein
MTEPTAGEGGNTKSAPRAKERSPNYPSLTLTDAIASAQRLYDAEKRTTVSQDSASRAFGFGSLSGAARSVIASLRQYGLVENSADGIRISDVAMEILHNPVGSSGRAAALATAAMRPPLVAELALTHADASNETLRAFLITKKKFAPDGAARFVEAFRDALGYAAPADVGGTQPPAGAAPSIFDITPPLTTKPSLVPPKPKVIEPGVSVMQFEWSISHDVSASLVVTGDLDLDDVAILMHNLKGAEMSINKALKDKAKAKIDPTAAVAEGVISAQ